MRLRLLWASLCMALAGGCSHVGIVYTEYQQFSIASLRVTPENSAPLDLNIGWDQGNLAIVGKRGGGSQPGEAVSMIARTELGSEGFRSKARGDLLGAESYFISGTAALVTAVEDGKTVVIKSGDEVITETKTEGTPSVRIRAAFSMFTTEDDQLRELIKTLQWEVDELLGGIPAASLDGVRSALVNVGLMADDPEQWPADEDERRKQLRKYSRAGDDPSDALMLLRFRDQLRKPE